MLGRKYMRREDAGNRKLKKKAEQAGNTKYPNSSLARDILGNGIETLQEDIANLKAAENFRGSISLEVPTGDGIQGKFYDKYRICAEECPSEAINLSEPVSESRMTVDTGKCILCGRCQDLAPELFRIKSQPVNPVRRKSELILYAPGTNLPDSQADPGCEAVGENLRSKVNKILGRSLAVREVDTGSCNGCEVEINALNNPIYDIERFGIHFVASPRHADVLLVTGPGSRNMEIALRRTYEATPDPKIVIAVGACACSGGIFGDTYATSGGIEKIVPVDVFIPGCPPRPQALLYGLLLALDRIKSKTHKD
ncbi:MAG: NADH-quinone oxidoreductase subunit NuoB [Nitrososphaera sp.]|jgi:Ni,Fe-hydrogenase III small subunit/ferredoxin